MADPKDSKQDQGVPMDPVQAKAAAVLHDAFMLGWSIVELQSRVKIARADVELQSCVKVACAEPDDSRLRLASMWRAIFNRVAGLQNKAFPNGVTENTLYEPPKEGSLPYLYPQETDYADIGIPATDTEGKAVLSNYRLYDVTRRAINCLTLLHIDKKESLIPELVEQYQDQLVGAILAAKKNPEGGGVEKPTAGVVQRQIDLQEARKFLTERTVEFLQAWHGYLRENFYAGGQIPNNDSELLAYEAGHAMGLLSWGISDRTAHLENRLPGTSRQILAAWKDVFRDTAVIRLQHQISALSSVLDDAYYLQHQELKRQDDNAVLVAPNPDLPSQAIHAVKHSIEYWRRTVNWLAGDQSQKSISKPPAVAQVPWPDMRTALTEQANIWQMLMTGQQSLRAFNMESVTQKLLQDVTNDIRKSVCMDFGGSVRQAEQVMSEMAREAKEIITRAGQTAIQNLGELLESCKWVFWPIVLVIGVFFTGLVIWALNDTTRGGIVGGASGGAGVAGIVSTIIGYFGLRGLKKTTSAKQQAIQAIQETAQTQVDSKTATGTEEHAGADSTAGNLLTRIESAAHETSAMVLKAFEQGYEQIRIELDWLTRSVAVAYPLVELFVQGFTLEHGPDFLTTIIWNSAERAEEVRQVARAAFGPLAVFITSPPESQKENSVPEVFHNGVTRSLTMGDRTKRIFISDIHMSDERSMTAQNPYAWFKNNIVFLAQFLDEQLQAPDVKEVVILGDLFDEWIIPSDYDPITSFDSICSYDDNKPVIEKLQALAANPDIKLAYVPGNHDMAMDAAGIAATKQFMDKTFPGIRFFCDNTVPCGVYNVGTLAAEHGNRYCLFNAPDTWTKPGVSLLPLGYFISRIVTHKVLETGHDQDPRKIFFDFLKDFMVHPDFVADLFSAIVQDAGLNPGDTIKLNGVPGYPNPMTPDDVKKLFCRLISNWERTPGNINVPSAIAGDLENLLYAASSTYFHAGSHINVAIFGHTHVPIMCKSYYDGDVQSDNAPDPNESACRTIYANSGTWVDLARKGGAYVETEEVQDEKRLYVRVKEYPGNTIISDYGGFVEL